jgi:hypothetical protein
MILSALPLVDVCDANSWQPAKNVEFSVGDSPTIYFQLCDASKGMRRYMPAAGAILTCVVGNIDDAKKVTRLATQPFPLDPSIWVLSILSSDPVRGTQNLTLTLNESGKITHGLVKNLFRVSPSDCL